MHIDRVESAIADFYVRLQLSDELRMQTEQLLLEQIAELREESGVERGQLVTRQRQALTERGKLLEAHYAGAVPLDLMKSEQTRLAVELAWIEERLAALDLRSGVVEQNLKRAFDYVGDLRGAYLRANGLVRRRMNQALVERYLLTDDGDIAATLRKPFDLLLQASGVAGEDGVIGNAPSPEPRGPEGPRGLSKESLVGVPGLEPGTPRV